MTNKQYGQDGKTMLLWTQYYKTSLIGINPNQYFYDQRFFKCLLSKMASVLRNIRGSFQFFSLQGLDWKGEAGCLQSLQCELCLFWRCLYGWALPSLTPSNKVSFLKCLRSFHIKLFLIPILCLNMRGGGSTVLRLVVEVVRKLNECMYKKMCIQFIKTLKYENKCSLYVHKDLVL